MTNNLRKRLNSIFCFAGFGLPALIIWASVVLIPFIYGIWITFTDWNGLAMEIHYVGIKNYLEVFSDATFVTSFLKTVIYAFFTVLASNLVGFLLALAVTSGIKGQ
ncbi:MAG: sugar ABC transporter permease, partial [Butyrivibrio sp.]|nr:sugar ABC transporter permease [Butyrivibrio sp.]